MFRQLLGILILFTFLFVKGKQLFAGYTVEKIVVASSPSQDADEQSDDEKESKNTEFADEFIHDTVISLSAAAPSKKLIHTHLYHISLVHFPVWGPPPNCAVSQNA